MSPPLRKVVSVLLNAKMPLLWNHSGGGRANSHFLFFSPPSSPVAFKGVFQRWFPDFVTPSNAADWPVAGKTRRKMFSVGGQQGERARPPHCNLPVPAAFQGYLCGRENKIKISTPASAVTSKEKPDRVFIKSTN